MTKHKTVDIDPVQRLNALIKDIRVAMLVTHSGHSGLHGRPMETSNLPFDGHLWFITSTTSPKTTEIERDAEVALVYCDVQTDRYVYVSGRASLVQDKVMLDRVWHPRQQTWFPRGKNDPDLRLLQVTVTRALYWIRSGKPEGASLDDSGTIELEERPVSGADAAAAQHTRPVVHGAEHGAHNVGRVGRRERH